MCNGTQVVNRHYESFDEYIGRGTPAGNPFIVGELQWLGGRNNKIISASINK